MERRAPGEFRVPSLQQFWSLQAYLQIESEPGQSPICVPMLSSAAQARWSIDLRKRQRCDLQILDASGAPAGGMALGVAKTADEYPIEWLGRITADAAGRATILLPDCECVVYAFVGLQHGVAILDGMSKRVELQMKRIPTMRCELVVATGEPAALARVANTDFE